MKNSFFKTVLAVICGILILQIVGFIFFMSSLVGVAASGGKNVILPRNGVLDIDLSKVLVAEQGRDNSMPDLQTIRSGEMIATVGLWDVVQALKAAAADPSVQYVLLRPEGSLTGISTTEELRASLADFRRSGKAVVAYLQNPGNASYYLATVSDKIYMSNVHGGQNSLLGLTSQTMYLKDVLDKLGVNVQLIRHGKYKSAGEMFVRNSSSPENREQNQALVDAMWRAISEPMAEAREIELARLNSLIDNLELEQPEDFLEAGLVDSLMDHEALVAQLCTLAQVQKSEDLHLIPLADYISAKVKPAVGTTKVAVLYADGEIVDSDDPEQISGDRFVREIDKLRKDSSVKAVVLRVNSPGGSVSASEKIRSALDLLQKEKPLVASYGNYAASGGYWISNGCSRIFADRSTVTGSIGVFSMIPEFSKVIRKIGVGIEVIGSNKHSGMLSLIRPFDAKETAYLQASVEDIYERFVNLVAEGRDMDTNAVDAIAQGRVWSGSDALRIGLVDEIGTLEDAIAYAASQAGLVSADDYVVSAAPAVPTFMEQLLKGIGQLKEEPSILSGTPFAPMASSVEAVLSEKNPGQVFARLPYSLEIR